MTIIEFSNTLVTTIFVIIILNATKLSFIMINKIITYSV